MTFTSLAVLGVVGASVVSAHGGGGFVVQEHLGSKRAYPLWTSRARRSHVPQSCDADPVQVQLTLRHGHRTKDPDDIEEYLETLDFFRANNLDADWLDDYELPAEFVDTNEDQLTSQGRFEEFRLGRRYGRRYKHLFNDYTPSHTVFFPMHATSKDRTIESAVSFSLGFFQREGKVNRGTQPLPVVRNGEPDHLVRFKECNRWDVDMDDNEELNDKQDAFEDAMYEQVAQRLTATHGFEFDTDHAEIIWDACQVLASLDEWNGEETWCSLLTNDEILGLEYGEDAGDYYKYGVGSMSETRFLASAWIQQAVQDMDEAVAGEGVRGRFMFGHSSDINVILNLLNLYMDEEPLPTDAIKEDRLFKQSEVTTMSSHVSLELYTCDDEPVVRVILNEDEVKLPDCSSLFCPLSEFKALMQPQLDFDLATYCES